MGHYGKLTSQTTWPQCIGVHGDTTVDNSLRCTTEHTNNHMMKSLTHQTPLSSYLLLHFHIYIVWQHVRVGKGVSFPQFMMWV